MPHIQPVSNVSSNVADIFREIEETFGMVPNLFSTYAHYPPLLESNWNKVKALMLQGELRREVKETIAILVSQDNSCSYCVAAHTGALKALGVSDTEIAALEKNLDNSDFSAKEKALINFARMANREPHRIPEEVFDAIVQNGGTEAEIMEALGVMELFTSFNRFLDSLEVEIDF